jgi:hypothetical protein
MTVHDTAYLKQRSIERGFTVEQAIETVTAPRVIRKFPIFKGEHGGFIR